MFLVVSSVLRRVRQLEKKLMMTDGRLPPVREVLARFSTKLSDAQGFLQKAVGTVQETESKNRNSIVKVQRNEVISHDPPSPLSLYLGSNLVTHLSPSQNSLAVHESVGALVYS